MYVCMYV